MSWIDAEFPPCLAFGIECNPEWATTVITTLGGRESRLLAWADARHSFDASFAVRTLDDHALIRAHFHQARGRTHSWPLLDPTDHAATITEGFAENYATNQYQLVKRYGSGAYAYDRKITRPFGVALYKSGVLQTSGYTLDEDTGVVSITGTSAAALTWSGSFYVPCRYDTNRLPTRVVNRNGQDLLIESGGIPIVEVKE
jgi:uncharacterized protein (TIGR02217 family)